MHARGRISHIRILGIGPEPVWGRLMSFTFEKTPRISLSCKLVPVQYREYEYGLLFVGLTKKQIIFTLLLVVTVNYFSPSPKIPWLISFTAVVS